MTPIKKIKELERIAAARTPGHWEAKLITDGPGINDFIYRKTDCGIPDIGIRSAMRINSEFIAMSANHIDSLLKVARKAIIAAQKMPCELCGDCYACDLKQALEELANVSTN